MTIIWCLIIVNANSWALEKAMKMKRLSIMKSELKNYSKETAWYYNRRASQFQQTFNKCMQE